MNGPEIRKLKNDQVFEENFNPLESEAKNQFYSVIKKLGNYK